MSRKDNKRLICYPESGDKGGQIVVSGTPEEVADHPTSHIGRYLKQLLAQHPPEAVAV